MKYIFTAIFILSLGGGWAFARFLDLSTAATLACLAGAGFIGSSIIALLFAFFYFFYEETDKEKIERLQEEIAELKKDNALKRLES